MACTHLPVMPPRPGVTGYSKPLIRHMRTRPAFTRVWRAAFLLRMGMLVVSTRPECGMYQATSGPPPPFASRPSSLSAKTGRRCRLCLSADGDVVGNGAALVDTGLGCWAGRRPTSSTTCKAFVTTWLGFGMNQARERYVTEVIKSVEGARQCGFAHDTWPVFTQGPGAHGDG